MKPLEPRVSVIVPAYNAERDIDAALASLSDQTFTDFEVVVVDDGSTDRTAEHVERLGDARIRLVRHELSRGLAAARNSGAVHARGEILALLDADARALPQRLAMQVAALDADPALQLVGSHLAVDDDAGHETGIIWRRPVRPGEAAIQLLFRDTLSGIALRRSAWPTQGPCLLPAAQDYGLNACIAADGKVANLDCALTRVRPRRDAPTRLQQVLAESCIREVMRAQLRRVGVEPSERELTLNRHIGGYTLPASVQLLQEVEAWLIKLCLANCESGRFPDLAFKRVLGIEWYEVCKFAAPLGRDALNVWRASPLLKHWQPSRLEFARFFAKCLLRHEREGNGATALA